MFIHILQTIASVSDFGLMAKPTTSVTADCALQATQNFFQLDLKSRPYCAAQQNSSNSHYDLGYDLAGQLVSSQSDSGSAFNAYISGTVHAGDVVSVTAYDASLTATTPVGQETASYTVMSGDTASSIATALASAIGSAMSNISVTATATGSVVAISTSASYCTSFTCAVTGSGATDTIALSQNQAIQPLHKQLYYTYNCASNRTGVQGDSTGTFPTGLTTNATQTSYNCVNALVSTSAGGPVAFQATTVNPVKAASVNVNQLGTLTGNTVVYLAVHDPRLSQAEVLNYTVQTGDTWTTVATNLASEVNADTTLSNLGVTATSSGPVVILSSSSSTNTTYTMTMTTNGQTVTVGTSSGANAAFNFSKQFSASPTLASGANTAAVTAVSGGGTPTTNTYPVTINSTNPQSFTQDANGNMTSDGTNSYAWDAENRLVQITRPGTGNYSTFVYDALGHCVNITETVNGTLSSTKQFVWCGNRMCEARDANSNIISQYFGLGQITSASNYFYQLTKDGTVVGMTNNAGTSVSSRSYDPYGVVTVNSETVTPDFGYCGYYLHGPSGLNLTLNRAYSSNWGRWLSRDPIGERAGVNLYRYVGNDPIAFSDPTGLQYAQPITYGTTWGAEVGAPFGPWGSAIGGLLGGLVGLGGAWWGEQAIGNAIGNTAGNPGNTGQGIAKGNGNTGIGTHCQAGKPTNPPNEENPQTVPIPTDPSQPPAPGWTWVGGGAPGTGSGDWVSPDNNEALHPDLEHGPPEGPHWAYTDPDGHQWRMFPDGSFHLKY